MNFTEGYFPLIFTDIINWSTCIYISAHVLYIMLSLPANCYILWLMLTGKGTEWGSDFFTFNLAVGEIFYCCGSVISYAIFSINLIYPKFFGFIGVMPIFGRPLFLCLICVERYVAVVYPITFLKCKPLRYRVTCCAVVWMTVVAFGLFCMFTLSSNNIFIFICVALPIYTLFLTIKLVCCLAVLQALKCPGPGERGRQREEANLIKRKAITHILILTVAMVINYAPSYLVGIFYGILPANDFAALVRFSASVSMIAGFVQPFLYIKQFGNLILVFRKCTKS